MSSFKKKLAHRARQFRMVTTRLDISQQLSSVSRAENLMRERANSYSPKLSVSSNRNLFWKKLAQREENFRGSREKGVITDYAAGKAGTRRAELSQKISSNSRRKSLSAQRIDAFAVGDEITVLLWQPISGRRLAVIYADSAGKIQGYIFANENAGGEVLNVRGLPSRIKVNDEDYLRRLRVSLESNCFITYARGELELCSRLRGGGWKKWFGVLFGCVKIAGAVAAGVLMENPGEGGVIAGSALLSSGIEGIRYALTADDEGCDFAEYSKSYVKASVIGGVFSGIASAVLLDRLPPVPERLVTRERAFKVCASLMFGRCACCIGERVKEEFRERATTKYKEEEIFFDDSVAVLAETDSASVAVSQPGAQLPVCRIIPPPVSEIAAPKEIPRQFFPLREVHVSREEIITQAVLQNIQGHLMNL